MLVADRDIRSAEACLAGADPIPEAAAYHCQQAAEKLIKGLLVLARTPFRKTHDMEVLRAWNAGRRFVPSMRQRINLGNLARPIPGA